MRTVKLLKVAASSLVLGAAFLTGVGASAAGDSDTGSLNSIADNAEGKARVALSKRKFEDAISWAEKAVAAVPNVAKYRLLLGETYLAAGRFASAETSFADALSLSPGNDRAALKLALSKIALGKAQDAVGILEQNKAGIAKADYGLALALAGDTTTAISTLQEVARGPEASAKARQNLAFSFAMAGRWAEARIVASQDLSTQAVDQRLSDWAVIARPRAAWDQVASLLKITPSYDEGQPKALALAAPSDGVAVAAAEPVVIGSAPATEVAQAVETASAVTEALPEVPPPPAAEPVQVAMAEPQPVAAPSSPGIVYSSSPVVQSIPAPRAAPVIRSNKTPIKQPLREKAAPAKTASAKVAAKPVVVQAVPASQAKKPVAISSGRYAVQLGAFSSASRADAAWSSATRNTAGLSKYDRSQSRVTVNNASLYRLAVAGFASREDAARVCTQVRAKGGSCFIRPAGSDNGTRLVRRTTGAGTKLATASRRKTVKVASR